MSNKEKMMWAGAVLVLVILFADMYWDFLGI